MLKVDHVFCCTDPKYYEMAAELRAGLDAILALHGMPQLDDWHCQVEIWRSEDERGPVNQRVMQFGISADAIERPSYVNYAKAALSTLRECPGMHRLGGVDDFYNVINNYITQHGSSLKKEQTAKLHEAQHDITEMHLLSGNNDAILATEFGLTCYGSGFRVPFFIVKDPAAGPRGGAHGEVLVAVYGDDDWRDTYFALAAFDTTREVLKKHERKFGGCAWNLAILEQDAEVDLILKILTQQRTHNHVRRASPEEIERAIRSVHTAATSEGIKNAVALASAQSGQADDPDDTTQSYSGPVGESAETGGGWRPDDACS